MKDEKNEKDEIVIQAIPTASLQDAESSQEFLAAEHALTFWPALRQHWPTVAWALFMNLATILKGIDGGVVKGIVGLDVFKQNYGYAHEGRYILAARWLSAFNYANLLGAIVGALFAGLAYDRFGPRIVLTGCSCLSIGFIFVQFFSQTPAQLFVGELINGCVIAFYPICASAYVGEVTPLPLRGFAATMTNLAFSIGSLIASGILKGTTSLASDWSYRIPIATQWALPCIMLALVPFCPDPPYWLCRQGRPEAAAASLRRLTVRGGAIGPRLAHIQETLRLEASFQPPTTARSLECLQGPNRRRLLICVMAYSMQAFTGNVFFINYAVHFMETAGLNASHAFSMNLGLSALGLLGTILSWPLLAYVGRRTMYLTGCSALALTQLLIGVLDVVPRGTGTIWAQCALMLACTLVYDVSLGPFCYVLLAEVSSMRLRGVTIGLATVSCFVWSVVFAVVIPYAMDADEGDWGGKLGFLFAGTSLVCAAMCFWWLPETQGRTFEELDAMFEQGVRSRRFRRCVVVIGEEGRGAAVAMREEGGGRRGGY